MLDGEISGGKAWDAGQPFYTFEYKGEEFHSNAEAKAKAASRLKERYAPYNDEVILSQWEKVLSPERILDVGDPKAIVDIMLGAIAISEGKRTLEEYIEDLNDREQGEIRIEHVKVALTHLNAFKSKGYLDGKGTHARGHPQF